MVFSTKNYSCRLLFVLDGLLAVCTMVAPYCQETTQKQKRQETKNNKGQKKLTTKEPGKQESQKSQKQKKMKTRESEWKTNSLF